MHRLCKNIAGPSPAIVRPAGAHRDGVRGTTVSIDGTTHEGVISGVSVSTPPGSVLNARLLKFWYKDMEDK